MASAVRDWLKANWFVIAVPPLLLIEWLLVRSLGTEMGPHVEAVVLFDLCLFMPLLYVLCYRGKLPFKHLLLRVLGLTCFGVYLASYIVPNAAQQLLPNLSLARTAGLAVLALVELRLLIAVLRLTFGAREATADQVQAASGAPRWVARLLLLEARFWKAAWRLIRRR
jgi:hypothetical protein